MSPMPSAIGPYRVERELARGGMGVVYLATDTRLDRRVALKALPEDFAADPDRLLRFEREAKVLAALSHPNLAGIYGVEEVAGRRYLALEYVEGETLAARIARGPLSVTDAVEICVQIASGLEAAHESGIVHRDLKPGNVMITPGDQVKVVDFGLAKGRVAERGPGSPDSPAVLDSLAASDAPTVTESPALAQSPTIGTPATLPGVILGTAAYLSPEQARGKVVDRRTDIWSFGCVLYECLTGRRAFEGETVSDVVAAILTREVAWERLPKSTPARLRELLQRCLERDPKMRLRDIGDAQIMLAEIREGRAPAAEAPGQQPRLLSGRGIALAVTVAVICAAAGIGLWSILGPGRGTSDASRSVRRFSVALPPEIKWTGSPDLKGFAFTGVVISPDGRYLIATGAPRTKDGVATERPRIYRRRIDGDKFEPVEGSEGATGFLMSPDGRWLFFIVPKSERTSDLHLMKTSTDGATPPATVTAWNPAWADWVTLDGGDILATNPDGSYVRVHSDGRPPSGPIKFILPKGVEFDGFYREGLPGNRGALVGIACDTGAEARAGVGVLDPHTGRVKVLLNDGAKGAYVRTGHLLFTRRSTLFAVAFDLDHLETRGQPVAIADGLRSEISVDYHASFSISNDGTLAFLPGGVVGERRRLIVVDELGHVTDWSPERAFFTWTVSAAPGGDRIATLIQPIPALWISERGRPAAKRIFTAPPKVGCSWPEFSPDGGRIAFTCYGDSTASGIYVVPADGSAPARQVCRPTPPTWFGKIAWGGEAAVLGSLVWSLPNRVDVVRAAIPASGDSREPPRPLIAAPDWREYRAVGSPNGNWIAYVSNETGGDEVYLAPCYPEGTVGPSRMVSIGGGIDPQWSRDGATVFYRSQQRRWVMAVPLRFHPKLTVGEPHPRWDLDQLRVIEDGGTPYDLLPEGEMVAIQRGEGEEEPTRVEVVLNFFTELKQKMRAAGVR